LDFGYTNSPAALVMVGVNRKAKKLYLKKLLYSPIADPDTLLLLLRKLLIPDIEVWADSADPTTIGYLRQRGIKVYAATKPPGSIKAGISLMKRFNINIVEDQDFMNEQANYKYKVIHGIKLDEPEDRDNHLWDAARYPVFMRLRHEK
jgi:phage terminase large subunit